MESDTGLLFFYSGDHTVKIVSCATGRSLRVLDGHLRTPWVVSVLADPHHLPYAQSPRPPPHHSTPSFNLLPCRSLQAQKLRTQSHTMLQLACAALQTSTTIITHTLQAQSPGFPFLEVPGFASGTYPLSSCHGVIASLQSG